MFTFTKYQNYYEVKEEDDKYVINIYAPGLDKKKFNVSLEDKTLTVTYPDQLHKSFTLPDNKGIEAHYKDGVLSIEVERKQDFIKVL